MIKKISSITIAKNEARNLGRCLNSLKGVIDEIIVLVDDSSEDNTFEIAEKYADIVEYVKWKGYSETKKLSLAKCSNEWILWIDADEELTEDLISELEEWKNREEKYTAYKVARRAFFLGKWIKHSGWYPGYVTRLFNKNGAEFSDSDVHEFLVVNGEIGTLKNDINHYTDPDIKHYFDKFNRYTSLAADELYQKGKTANLIDLLIRPLLIFLKMFIFRAGYLDGIHGFILAAFSSMYVFTKYAKLFEKKYK